MREIKFRGINAETGKWVHGFLFKTDEKTSTDRYDFTDSYILDYVSNEDVETF